LRNDPDKNLPRPRRYKGFVLKKGNDGLVTIFCASGFPLTRAFKFIEFETARSFVDQWVSLHEKALNDLQTSDGRERLRTKPRT
jgi:hypothetical protein